MGYWRLLLPMIEIATIWWLVSRIAYHRYPALLTYLATEAAAQTAVILAGPWWVTTWAWSQPIRLAIRTWVVFEVYQFACLKTARRQRIILAGYAAGAALLCMVVVSFLVRLSPLDSFTVFRQYYMLFLAAALVGITYRVWREPLPENRDHKVYRLSMTAYAAFLAVAGMFVQGGFANLFLPYSGSLWRLIDAASWGVACVLVVGMGYGMSSNLSCLRPEVAFPELFGDLGKKQRRAA